MRSDALKIKKTFSKAFVILSFLFQGACISSEQRPGVISVTKNSKDNSHMIIFEGLLSSVKNSLLKPRSTCFPVVGSNNSEYILDIFYSVNRQDVEILNVIEYENEMKKFEAFMFINDLNDQRLIVRIYHKNGNCIKYNLQLLVSD